MDVECTLMVEWRRENGGRKVGKEKTGQNKQDKKSKRIEEVKKEDDKIDGMEKGRLLVEKKKKKRWNKSGKEKRDREKE